MKVASDVTELVGETPLVDLGGLAPNLLGKLEADNPYSVKDRIAREMIERAEDEGVLDGETGVVEATSGNTGIGVAAVCAAKGYDLTLTMPASMSEERREMLLALGADLVVTPADGGMGGAIEAAEELAAGSNAVRLRQFENRANPAAHRRTTGPEIWEATEGEVDAVVAGVGTGGTITGVGEHLTEDRDADVRMVAVEPEGSPLLSEGDTGDHEIQGIGPSFVPETLRRDLVDEVRAVATEDAKQASRDLAARTGLLVGVSSGAALSAAVDAARERPDDVVVVVLPDTGERYLSTDLFADGRGSLTRLEAPRGTNTFGVGFWGVEPGVGPMTTLETDEPVTDRRHENSWSASLESPRHADDRALVVAQGVDAVRHTAPGNHVNLVTHGEHGHPESYLFAALDAAFESVDYEFVERCGCGGYVTRVHRR